MNLLKLIFKEISYRKVNFLLSCFAVSVAAASVIAAFSLLAIHDIKTRELLDEKVAETNIQVQALEDDIRKITKKMGFNVLILPADQNLDDFYSDNYASKFMPESYVKKLAASRVVTVRHLLPTLEQKVKWPEKSRTVILVGIRGEVPFIHKDPKKPIVSAVKPGTVILGHNLADKMSIKQGDKIFFMGEMFSVSKIYSERGNKDDITIWMDLKKAQSLLGKDGKINGILALECKCAWANINKVRRELLKILPDTKIITFAGKAEARKAARSRVETAAQDAMINIKSTRAEVRGLIEKSTAIVVPLVIVLASIWVAILAFSNTRERRYEIGLMRAVGVKSKSIFALFISRALIMSVIGMIDGILIGLMIGVIIGHGVNNLPLNSKLMSALFNTYLLSGVVLMTPLLTVVSAWVPALYASQQDPADILREE
jgi:ABC-type lipoprotein release transport system permease subunit